MLGLSRWNPLSLRRREIQHVWALSVCDTSGLPLDALSVFDNSDFPSDESGNLLNMIMDSGGEEHVVSLADWKSLGEPVLKPAQVRLRSATGDDMGVSGSFVVRGWCEDNFVFSHETCGCQLQHRDDTHSVCLNHSGGGSILASKMRQADSSEKISCDQCHHFFRHEARGTVSQELRAMRAGHLSASEVRLPWTPEE